MGVGDSCGHISTDEMEKIANIKKLVSRGLSIFFHFKKLLLKRHRHKLLCHKAHAIII